MDEQLKTRESLLGRLKDSSDYRAWETFYEQYAPLIVRFCLKRGLDESGARDVVQESMMMVLRKFPGFTYDPAMGRFRNWLLTLVMGKIREVWRRAERTSRTSREFALNEVAAPWGSAQLPEEDWRQSVLEEALRRVAADPSLKPGTFELFRAYVLESGKAKEVAIRFGVDENVVYQIKNRLLKRLRTEVEALEEP